MNTVASKDGTRIAFERMGQGPALILVDGALCHRAMGPSRPVAELLAARFTVYIYDRRGRGDSGNTAPYSIEREIEDLAALIEEAGGSAFVCGFSSGAALGLEAANHGLPIRKLALYEAPFIVDATYPPSPGDFAAQLYSLVSANRRGDAVRVFMRRVGVPPVFVMLMRLMPNWSKLEAVAHTLPYDITIVQGNQRGVPFPPGQWASATAPTLVLEGGKSPAWMRNAMHALAGFLPNAKLHTLHGQTHMVKAKVLAPVLAEYFAAGG